MDATLKAKWVEALRSGKYEKGESYIFNDGRYCCLGVLLDLQGYSIMDRVPDLDARMMSVLPDDYACGLTADQTIMLANRNDGVCSFPRHTFQQIADYIEKNL